MSWKTEVEGIEHRRHRATELGGAEAVDKQHQRGRLTVRERIERLLDACSFREQGPIAGYSETDDDGNLLTFTPANYVLGVGLIDGRACAVGGEDFTQRGGSPTPAGLRKSVYAEDLACRYRVPLVRFLEGGGGSVAGAGGKDRAPAGDPVYARARFASIGEAMASVPVVSAALGAVAGLPAARLVSSHFALMVRDTAQVLIAGPAVVERALGEHKSKQELGGAEIHGHSGVVDNVCESEEQVFAEIRRFLGYLPSNVWELPPRMEVDDDPGRQEEELLSIVPRDRRLVFDVRRLLELIVDRGSFFEMTPGLGPSQVTRLAPLSGQPVGVIANDSRYYAGAMSAEGAQKVRRFVDLCDTFHLPIVSFVDEPGFMIGAAAEAAATIRHGAAAIFSVMQSSVPWASVHVRKAYGVAAAAHFGRDSFVLAWPSAEAGALPVEGGVAVAFHREIAAAEDPDARRRELEEQFASARSPFPRAEAFGVHDLIDPRRTRPMLCDWIELAQPLLATQLHPRS
ncbi:MAG: acyl-CoA carboxylase subunit beta, partial [Candidatus Binatia bacterium]